MSIIEARLSQLGVRISSLFKPEIRELQKILVDGEEIVHIVPGRYFGGYALLAATDRRLLLIDKKALFLTLEDIRYDMISEVDFSARLMDASMVLFTVNKQHRFTAMKHKLKLRELTKYVQQRVMELRYGALDRPATEEASQVQPVVLQLEAKTQAVAEPAPINAVPIAPEPASSSHLQQLVVPVISQGPAKLKQLVGAAALHNTPWSHVNPYTKTSFMTRHQYSRFS